MYKRNEFMVNNSSRLIAAVSDYRSGSGQTVRMALKQGLDIRYIDIEALEAAANQYNELEFYDMFT